MILEDQYGVGDVVDLGAASGTVEAVGLRVTRLRDGNGTLWYARNGEVLRVGNKSKGFAQVTVDLPVPYGSDVDAAGAAMQAAADELVARTPFADAVLEEPELLGVEQIDVERGRAAADGQGAARPTSGGSPARCGSGSPTGWTRTGMPPAATATGWTCTPSRPGGEAARGRPPADGSGGQPLTGPTDSDPTRALSRRLARRNRCAERATARTGRA